MRLIYISSCAIHEDGSADPFLLQEKAWLLAHFDRVEMISYYGIATLDQGDRPRLSRPAGAGFRALLTAPFSHDLHCELKHLRADGRLSLKNVLKALAFVKRGLKMHYWLENLLGDDCDTTLYSFWMSFDAYAAALSKRKHPQVRFVARGHAFDVDVERNPMNPYLMKSAIADAADGLYPISETTRQQLLSYMHGRIDASKLHVLAMGSGGSPVQATPPPCLSDGVLRLVSCAKVIEIKQVPLLAEALAMWDGMPIEWTHIGGGDGWEALKTLCKERLDDKENVTYALAGELSSAAVQDYYAQHPTDLFVNTSRKEGAPVSVMEALRFGVPAIAPDVGGLPEMLSDGAGILWQPRDGASGIRAALGQYVSQSDDSKRAMRHAAKQRWDTRYQSEKLLFELFGEKEEQP